MRYATLALMARIGKAIKSLAIIIEVNDTGRIDAIGPYQMISLTCTYIRPYANNNGG